MPKRSLINAFALRALAFNCARLATPAAAGLLIAVTGPGPTLVVGALMYLARRWPLRR